jgi:hypothetical protein
VTLAWIPFLQPAPGVPSWWWLLVVPLSLFLSMGWKAVRVETFDGYWTVVGRMAAQIVLGMIGMFVALAVLVRVVLPVIPAE